MTEKNILNRIIQCQIQYLVSLADLWGSLGMYASPSLHPAVEFLSFSCSFRHKSCQIIGFLSQSQQLSPLPVLEILDPPLGFVWSGADPGFPVGGGANLPGEGANIQICQIFPKNAPLDPPLMVLTFISQSNSIDLVFDTAFSPGHSVIEDNANVMSVPRQDDNHRGSDTEPNAFLNTPFKSVSIC